MDKNAAELSRASLKLASNEMSPEYLNVKAKLLGYLAAHGSTVEQLAAQEKSARENRLLLSRFAQLLPKAELTDQNWTLWLDDPYTLRIMQSVMIWSEELSGSKTYSHDDGKTFNTYARHSYRPFVILGKRGKDNNELLIACIGEDDDTEQSLGGEPEHSEDDEDEKIVVPRKYGELYLYEPKRRDRKKIAGMGQILETEYPAPVDMAKLFNKDRHMLEVDSSSPGSTRLVRKIDRWDYNHTEDRIFDEQLGAFDVISHLNRISVALGLEQQLAELISQHSIVDNT